MMAAILIQTGDLCFRASMGPLLTPLHIPTTILSRCYQIITEQSGLYFVPQLGTSCECMLTACRHSSGQQADPAGACTSPCPCSLPDPDIAC